MVTATRVVFWSAVALVGAGLIFGLAVYRVMERKDAAYEACDPSRVGASFDWLLSGVAASRLSVRKPDDEHVDIGYPTLGSEYWVCRVAVDAEQRVSGIKRLPPVEG